MTRARIGPALGLAAALALGCGGDETINSCDLAEAADHTGQDVVEIEFGGLHGHQYVPACVRASAGSRLVFRGTFELHPLGAGRVVEGKVEPTVSNPIRDSAQGEETAFELDAPGEHGFFCHFHTGEGMMGAVFVE